MLSARRTELLTIRIEHGARVAPGELIEALQTIPAGVGDRRYQRLHSRRIPANRDPY